jgi:mono/diheme cytochrome c family protein
MRALRFVSLFLTGAFAVAAFGQDKKEPKFLDPIETNVPHISTDRNVNYDFDIVYVRAKRAGDKVHKRFFTDFSQPVTMEPGADLMLLHPDGKEERLVEGGSGSVTDPVVSLDGEWVYYSLIHNLEKANQWSPPRQGADVYKIHLKTKRVVKLTNQRFSPNTGAANWSKDFRTPEPGKSHFEYGVFNMGPCPLPGGRLAFTSNRDGFRPAKGYPAIALQLFVMDDRDDDIGNDDDPPNLEKIGHLNLAGALHPVLLRDGRIMYSSLESQGARGDILWGIWTIHPDGTNWNPLVSAFDPGGAPNGFHFQTQLSDGSIVVEEYYNQNNSGFGAYVKLPEVPPEFGFRGGNGGFAGGFGGGGAPSGFGGFAGGYSGAGFGGPGPFGGGWKPDYPAFGPANMSDPRNVPWRFGRFDNGNPKLYRMPFMPLDSVSLTPFTHGLEGPADHAVRGDKTSPAVGKFTHPSAAPDNHLLTCYSPGPVNHQYTFVPQLDGGIYLIKKGAVVNQPSEMRLIKNDPEYNECWPRAAVPYKRVYGRDPKSLPRLSNKFTVSKHLPEGTPFGLVGTASFYKRESYPNGAVPPGSVTAAFAGTNDPWKGLDPFTSHGNGMPLNWHNQGADAGLYTNADIHAVRILAMEPTTDRKGANAGRCYFNHAGERLRVLGEIPLRKFGELGWAALGGNSFSAIEGQPRDPDGNPDTSFLAKIPADVGFTFQTLDKNGLVLNMAQTWHQLRPGEIRNNCGGCHAHSQRPTDFNQTFAGKPDYPVWDLVNTTPLLTSKARDESKKKWDTDDQSGLRYAPKGPANVEYWRDIKPILARSCASCHTAKGGKEPAGKLDLDADDELVQYEHHGKFPGTYYRLALDEKPKYGYKPVGWDSWGYPNASRYIRKFQSRRSLLVWKIFGRRLDGFSNDDHPSETELGSGKLTHHGMEVDLQKNKARADLDFTGKAMPPGGWKALPLTDEARRTIARWIDLGCPIDLDYDPARPERVGYGWMLDDQRPTLTVTDPAPGKNAELSRFLIGMHDYGSGLNPDSLRVEADFAVNGAAPGENLAKQFQKLSQGVWELWLARPILHLKAGRLTVSIADRQGNVTKVERRFSIGR